VASQSLLDPSVAPVAPLDRRRSGRRITDLPKLAVVIPALNEGATIASVIAGVPRHIIGIQSVEVILVDDGSSDDTQDQARTGGVDVIVAHPHRRGLVAAFKLGVNEALRRGADIVVNLDGDGQHDPTCIPKMIGPIVERTADIVLGVRPLGDAKDEMSPVRRYGNQVGSWVTGKALGLEISDATSGYRAYARDALLRMNLVSENTYTLETLVHASRQHLRVVEVPVPAIRRPVGESRMTHSIWSYVRRTAGQAARSLVAHKLARCLALCGMVAMTAALGCTLKFVHGYGVDGAGRHTPALLAAVLTSVIALGFFVSAFMADGISTTRRLLEDTLYHVKRLEYESAAAAEVDDGHLIR
jgi:Glycosyl transferase family 2